MTRIKPNNINASVSPNRKHTATCHNLRKTGCVFAIWGDARIDVIRLDARHTCTKTSLAYEQDAVSMLSYANISNENAKYEVPRYNVVRVINQAVSSEVYNIGEPSSLAKLYVETDLRVAPVADFYRSPVILMTRAEREVVEKSQLVSLCELMKANMSLGKYDDEIVLLGQLVCSVGLDGNDIEAQDPIVETGNSPTKRKRKDGDNNFEEKSFLKDIIDPMEKLEIFLFYIRVSLMMEGSVSLLTLNNQSFLNVYGNSLMKKYSKSTKNTARARVIVLVINN